jgi:glycine cleavage system aminomethyltransferase T
VDGKEIGHVTSAAWSPQFAAPLAIALVRRAQAKAGTRLTSDHGDAVVVLLPVWGATSTAAVDA